jgi:hypothetical protein
VIGIVSWGFPSFQVSAMNSIIQRVFTLALCALSIALLGCDPGYVYKPLKADGTTTQIWSASVGGVRLQDSSFTHFVGQTTLNAIPEIANNSGKTAVLVAAQLSTNGTTLSAEFPWEKELTKRTLAPGARATFTCQWNIPKLKRGEVDNLGANVTVTWRLRIGDEDRIITEEIVRTRGH